MDSQSATNSDSMISTQMPEPQKTIFTPYSDIKEPLLQEQDPSVDQSDSKDMVNLSGFEKLLSLEGVRIDKDCYREEVPCCQCSGCFDRDWFSYSISALGSGKGRRLPAIFQGSEDFDNCQKAWCCSPDLRGVDIGIKHREYDKSDSKNGSFLKLEKRARCSFLCFFKPEMIVTLVEEGKDEKLGKIVNSTAICDSFKVKIFDASDVLRFIIKGDCCNCMHGPLYKKMSICDPFGNVVSKVRIEEDTRFRYGGGCEFFMDFPKDSNGADRALLIAGILMIGKSFFDDSDCMRAWKECCVECPKAMCEADCPH